MHTEVAFLTRLRSTLFFIIYYDIYYFIMRINDIEPRKIFLCRDKQLYHAQYLVPHFVAIPLFNVANHDIMSFLAAIFTE